MCVCVWEGKGRNVEGVFPPPPLPTNKIQLTLGNFGLSRAIVARAPKATAVGVPVAVGLQATREMISARRIAKKVAGLKAFISGKKEKKKKKLDGDARF